MIYSVCTVCKEMIEVENEDEARKVWVTEFVSGFEEEKELRLADKAN